MRHCLFMRFYDDDRMKEGDEPENYDGKNGKC